MSDKWIVAQTTTYESPASFKVYEYYEDALEFRDNEQRKTKDLWEVALVIPNDSWLTRLARWLIRVSA